MVVEQRERQVLEQGQYDWRRREEELTTASTLLQEQLTGEQYERRRLQDDLVSAVELAAVSAVEQVPGLDDAELRDLKVAVRGEHTRRQQLNLQRQREAMERERREVAAMRAQMEREREAREEEMLCAICMKTDKDTALGCGHRACAACAAQLRVCHVCRAPIADADRRRLY
jgi:hypothetical protein